MVSETRDDQGEPKLTLKDAKVLFSAGDLEQARDACARLKPDMPKNWRLDVLASRIALELLEYPAAAKHISAAEANNAPTLQLEKLKLKYAKAMGAVSEVLRCLTVLRELEPENSGWIKQLLKVYAQEGDTQRAFAALKELMAAKPDAEINFAETIDLLEQADSRWAISSLTECLMTAPRNPMLLSARALMFFRDGQTATGKRDLENALNISPEWYFPPRFQRGLLRHFSDFDDGVSTLLSLQEAYPRNGSLLWVAAKALDFDGRNREASKLIDENWDWASKYSIPSWVTVYRAKSGRSSDTATQKSFKEKLNHNNLTEALDVSDTVEQRALVEEASKYPETPDDDVQAFGEGKDVVVFGKDRPNGIVISFNGFTGVPGIPAPLLDRFFAALGLVHINLSDPMRMIYLKGVRELGGGLDESIETLHRIIQTFEGRAHVYTFGSSGGSMAAIYYGDALKAKSSLIFSAFATIDDRYKDIMGDNRAGIVLRRLNRNLDVERFDLEKLLAHSDPDFTVWSYVSADDDLQRAHGEMLGAMPRVRTEYLLGESKSPLLRAAHQFGMMTVLRKSFGLAEGDAEAS